MFSVKDILRTEVAPALGCTEPVAIALATGAAASLLSTKEINLIEIWVDPNTRARRLESSYLSIRLQWAMIY